MTDTARMALDERQRIVEAQIEFYEKLGRITELERKRISVELDAIARERAMYLYIDSEDLDAKIIRVP